MDKYNSSKRQKYSLFRSILILSIVVISVFFIYNLYKNSQNSAKKSASFITSKIENIGGNKLCESGSTGHEFLSSTNPWYETYYLVPDSSSSLSELIIEEFSDDGYELIATKEFIQKYGRDGHGIQIRPLEYENKPENSFYISKTSDFRALVNIKGEPEADIKCEYKGGYKVSIPSGSKLVEINWNQWW